MLDPVETGAIVVRPNAAVDHRQVLATAAMLGGTTILVKLVAFAKDLLVADRLGAGDELDAYLLALMLPAFAIAVLGQSLTSVLLPAYVAIAQRDGTGAARRLAGGALAAGCGLLIVVAASLALLAPYLFPWLGLGFSPPKLALAESLFGVMAAILVVGGGSAIFSAVLNAEDHFAATALAPMAIPVCTLAMFWSLQGRLGVYALAGGTLLGFVVECGVLAVAAARYRLLEWPRWRGAGQHLSYLGAQYWPLALGSLLMSGATVVDQSMAASLGSGNVSVLNYGNKVVALVLSMVAVSLSTALFPRFSRMVALGHWDELKRALAGYTKTILSASIPCVGVLVWLSEPLVRILFERGSFTPTATVEVSQVQAYLALEIPFYILNMIGIRLLSAMGGNQAVLRISAFNLAINIVGDYVLMRWFGVNGIAISTVIVYLIASGVTLATIRAKLADAKRASAAAHRA